MALLPWLTLLLRTLLLTLLLRLLLRLLLALVTPLLALLLPFRRHNLRQGRFEGLRRRQWGREPSGLAGGSGVNAGGSDVNAGDSGVNAPLATPAFRRVPLLRFLSVWGPHRAISR